MFSSSDTEELEEATNEDEDVGDQIEVETVVPYRDSDSESEPEQLRSVSDFDLLSDSEEEESTASDAPFFRKCGGAVAVAVADTLWPGIAESCRLIQR